MQNIKVSYSSSIYSTNLTPRLLKDTLSETRTDKWKEIITLIRLSRDKETRNKYKADYLAYFVPGLFSNNVRKAENLISSKILVFDADNLTSDKLSELSSLLREDKSVISYFVSPSGNGLKIICELDKEINHYKTYSNIYLYYKNIFDNKYNIKLDNVQDACRACFLSWDLNSYIREEDSEPLSTSITFPEHNIPKSSNTNIKLIDKKTESVINFLEGRIPDYNTWLKFGFACASLGENGRPVFQRLSKGNPKYADTIDNINKQFDACLKNYDCDKTKFIHIFKYAKVLGWKYDTDEENPIDIIKEYLLPINLKRNIITRRIINQNGSELDKTSINTLYCDLKSEKPRFNYQDFERVIFSNFISDFNPIKDFFEKNASIEASGNIDKLICAMKPDNIEYAKYFITKWLVSVVASVCVKYSPLVLVLVGEKQNTGKTEFFRRLLPEELKAYYAESKLDNGKDDYILMCEKLLIMDDEFGGKNKLESKLFKELTSKQIFTLREPYGRFNISIPRLAVLCGTSNDYNLLSDPSGNRRIIPIHIEDTMDFELLNSVDRKALWAEVYNLFKSNYRYELNNDDIKTLEEHTTSFVAINPERELIQRYLCIPKPNEPYQELTATDIKILIERESETRVNINKLGSELQYMKFEKIHKKVNGKNSQLYRVKTNTLSGKFI